MTLSTTLSLPRRVPWLPLMFAGLWAWAIWSCAEHWIGNPNYSYGWMVPPLVFGFALRRYWLMNAGNAGSAPRLNLPLLLPMALGCGILIFLLEFARQHMWHPQIVLLTICFVAIGFSVVALRIAGGAALARAEIFPFFFFLTAVPWPARFEHPVTSTLMRWVAAATAEFLHWLGVEAETSGGAIALRTGLVGITEACSGVRSLQAGIMFGLAMGEWFLLRPGRRVVLLIIAIALAMATNLARTLALALQAEWHGVHSVEQVHDLIGNIVITTLIAGIWLAGKLLRPKASSIVPVSPEVMSNRVRGFVKAVIAPRGPALGLVVMTGLVGFISARVLYAKIESREGTQTSPFFVSQTAGDNRTKVVEVPRQIWNELRPSSGQYLRHEDPGLPNGVADFYHFFWKPSPWNRFVLVHRPDICMPGVGWEMAGSPQPVEIELNGHAVRCYLFRFTRGRTQALQLWGAWRNGVLVPLEYQSAQVLGSALPPPPMQLEGKQRSATEIVACSLISDAGEPSAEIAIALLQSVFQYNPR